MQHASWILNSSRREILILYRNRMLGKKKQYECLLQLYHRITREKQKKVYSPESKLNAQKM